MSLVRGVTRHEHSGSEDAYRRPTAFSHPRGSFNARGFWCATVPYSRILLQQLMVSHDLVAAFRPPGTSAPAPDRALYLPHKTATTLQPMAGILKAGSQQCAHSVSLRGSVDTACFRLGTPKGVPSRAPLVQRDKILYRLTSWWCVSCLFSAFRVKLTCRLQTCWSRHATRLGKIVAKINCISTILHGHSLFHSLVGHARLFDLAADLVLAVVHRARMAWKNASRIL